MIRIVLLSLVLASSRSADARDVPRPNLEGAQPPVLARMNQRASAVEASLDSADSWGRYAMFLHAQRCLGEADIAYEEAHRLAPTDFRWAYFRGLLLSKTKPLKSLQHLELAVQLDPNYGPAYIRLGLALQSVGREDDAGTAFGKAIRLQPTNGLSHLYMGQLELKRNNVQEAVRHLETAYTSQPEDASVLSSLSRAYARLGDRDRARKMANAARKTRPGRPFNDRRFNEVVKEAVTLKSFIDRSDVYFKAGQNEKAVSELDAALAIGHNEGSVYQAYANLYLKLADFDKCVESSRNAISLGRDDGRLYLVLGIGLFNLSQFDEAEDATENALKAMPMDQIAMRLYGRIAVARGNDVEAIERWNLALTVEDDTTIRRERAKALSRIGQHEEAVKELRVILSKAPDDRAAWFALGQVHQGAGDLEAALIAYDSAAENAKAPFAARHAAFVLMALQRFTEAELRLRNLRKRWPANPNLMNDLSWLLSTCPDDNVRNGAEALSVIRPLLQQTRRRESAVLDTFAAALAEVGRFSQATEAMDEVLALLSVNTPTEQRAGYQMRRDHYANKKAWREGS